MKQETKQRLIISIEFILVFMLIYGLVTYSLYSVKEKIDECKERNWDGSSILISKTPFTGKEVYAKCNKAPETDSMDAVISKFVFWTK